MTLEESSIRSEELFQGKLLHAYRDEVRLPDGDTSIREWIKHPGASAVVPLFEDGRTMLVRQFRFPPRREFLEVPAGKLDHHGESAEAVALRELEEETGWRAGKVIHLGSFYPCIGYSNEIIHFYLARGLEKGRQDLQHGEFMEVMSLAFTDALELLRRGEILDMKTATALNLAERFLEDEARETEAKGFR
ncbi:MAG TPA: NUDIX hydrolase [Rhodothermales bacterium]